MREQLEVKEEAIKQNTVRFFAFSDIQVEVSSLKEKLARVESNLQQVATPSASGSSEESLVVSVCVIHSRSGCRVFVGIWSGCSALLWTVRVLLLQMVRVLLLQNHSHLQRLPPSTPLPPSHPPTPLPLSRHRPPLSRATGISVWTASTRRRTRSTRQSIPPATPLARHATRSRSCRAS